MATEKSVSCSTFSQMVSQSCNSLMVAAKWSASLQGRKSKSRLRRVPQFSQSNNSLVPRHSVITLVGYGIQVRVDRGHLVLEDGIAADRRYARLPRVGHGLRRLVVVGADGMISLAALR